MGHLPSRMGPETYSILRDWRLPLKHMWMFSLKRASISATLKTHTADWRWGTALSSWAGEKTPTRTGSPGDSPKLRAKSWPATVSLAS